MKRTTAERVRKAGDDWVIAGQSSQGPRPLHDGVCFHCQQCSEKYLKGLMEELGLAVPKIHDLGVLLTTLRPHYPVLRPLRRGMAFLTNFAVPVRYPGFNASKRQAEAALRWADRV